MRGIVALLGLLIALRARADEPRVVVHAGATCLRREQLRLQDWITPEEIPPGAWLEVRGSSVDPRSVDVIVHDQRELGRRSFAPGPERCADLHHAVALAGAMLMRTAPARTPVGWELGARAQLSISAQLSAGARVHGGLQRGWWQVRAAALLLQGRDELSVGSFAARVLAGGAELCAGRLELRWCVGGWGGQLRARGRGFEPSVVSKLGWAALSTGPQYSLHVIARWWLSAQADLVVPLRKSFVVVDGSTERASLSRVALWAGLGLAYRGER